MHAAQLKLKPYRLLDDTRTFAPAQFPGSKTQRGEAGILGIETGAALGVVAAVYFLEINSLTVYVLFAFAGAALTAVVVYVLGSMGRGGPTPLKLTIAGAALTEYVRQARQG